MRSQNEQLQPAMRAPSLFRSIRLHLITVVLATLGTGVLGYLASSSRPPSYMATTRLHLSYVQEGAEAPRDPQRRLRDEAERVVSRAVLVRTAERLPKGAVTADQLESAVRAEPSQDVDLIDVRVVHSSAAWASRIANEVAAAFQEVSEQTSRANAERILKRLEQQQAELETRITQLDQEIAAARARAQEAGQPLPPPASNVAARTAAEEARLAGDPAYMTLQSRRIAAMTRMEAVQSKSQQVLIDAATAGSVDLIEPAVVPSSPYQPKPVRDGAVAAVIGLLASSVIAWQRSLSAETGMRRASLPVNQGRGGAAPEMPSLGQVPFDASLVENPVPSRTSGSPAASSAFEGLLRSVLTERSHRPFKTLLITSPSSGDGKSTTALNLASGMARHFSRVALVDADFRSKGLTKLLAAESSHGFSDAFSASPSMPNLVKRLDIEEASHLAVIPAGLSVEDPEDFIRQRFEIILDRISSEADLVVIDSPALATCDDARMMAQSVDAVILVSSTDGSSETLLAAWQRISRTGAQMLGYVLNAPFLEGAGSRNSSGLGHIDGSYPRRWGGQGVVPEPPKQG